MVTGAAALRFMHIKLPIFVRGIFGLVTLSPCAWAQGGSPTIATNAPRPAGTPHECYTRYPIKAFLRKEEGTVGLSFHIDRDGTVKGIVVSKSSGYAALDEASIACVSKWTYAPAMQNGQPVEVVKNANIEWDLPQSPVPIGAHDCRTEAQQVSTDRQITIQLIIGAEGHVKDAQLSQSTGNAVWDQSLVACIRTWQYRPGTVQGHTSDLVKRMPLEAFADSTRN